MKILYILYTDRLKQPDYGYFYPATYYVSNFIRYMTVNNFKSFPFPSLFWSIRKYIRHKDPFGYWTKFRRKEELDRINK